MRVATLCVLELVERKTRDLENIDAGEPGVWFGCKDTMHGKRQCVAKRLMARLEVYCRQHNRRVGEMAYECRSALGRRIARRAQPAPTDSQNAVAPRSVRALCQFHVVRMLQIKGQLGRSGITGLRINLQAAKDDLL
jgi:hypothetical protein